MCTRYFRESMLVPFLIGLFVSILVDIIVHMGHFDTNKSAVIVLQVIIATTLSIAICIYRIRLDK